MVKRLSLMLVLALCVLAGASESGRLSARAQAVLAAGRFSSAYSQYEVALLASRKESDLLSENRILISMAQIRIASLDLELADSLLAIVRVRALDESSKFALLQAKMSLKNAAEKPREVLDLAKSLDEKELNKLPKSLSAAIYSELALAFAATGDTANSNKNLDLVRKKLSKKDGRYIYSQARAAHLAKDWTAADSLYQVAEKLSIAENKIYRTATILYYRAGVAAHFGRNDDAADFKLRSANAFELMGLPKLKERSEK